MMRILQPLTDLARSFGYGVDAGNAIRHGRSPSPGARQATARRGGSAAHADQPASGRRGS